MSETKSTPSLESTLKSLDTEEFIDIHFYRPIGYQWALFFNKLGVSPNSITIASIFIGIAAGICFYFQSLAINVIGMLLLIWANSYDSADGQLARMTDRKVPWDVSWTVPPAISGLSLSTRQSAYASRRNGEYGSGYWRLRRDSSIASKRPWRIIIAIFTCCS